MPRVPLPPFHGGHASQPYAIPTCGAAHGLVGVVPLVPPPGSRSFGAGQGNAGASIDLLEISDLSLISLLRKNQVVSPLWVVNYLNLDLLIMFVLLNFLFPFVHTFFLCFTFLLM